MENLIRKKQVNLIDLVQQHLQLEGSTMPDWLKKSATRPVPKLRAEEAGQFCRDPQKAKNISEIVKNTRFLANHTSPDVMDSGHVNAKERYGKRKRTDSMPNADFEENQKKKFKSSTHITLKGQQKSKKLISPYVRRRKFVVPELSEKTYFDNALVPKREPSESTVSKLPLPETVVSHAASSSNAAAQKMTSGSKKRSVKKLTPRKTIKKDSRKAFRKTAKVASKTIKLPEVNRRITRSMTKQHLAELVHQNKNGGTVRSFHTQTIESELSSQTIRKGRKRPLAKTPNASVSRSVQTEMAFAASASTLGDAVNGSNGWVSNDSFVNTLKKSPDSMNLPNEFIFNGQTQLASVALNGSELLSNIGGAENEQRNEITTIKDTNMQIPTHNEVVCGQDVNCEGELIENNFEKDLESTAANKSDDRNEGAATTIQNINEDSEMIEIFRHGGSTQNDGGMKNNSPITAADNENNEITENILNTQTDIDKQTDTKPVWINFHS